MNQLKTFLLGAGVASTEYYTNRIGPNGRPIP